MCGINLIVDKRKRLDASFIRKMNGQTSHRGPEGSRVLSISKADYTLYFGHNLLKINDLNEAISQPLCVLDDQYTLIYNGEIYNGATLYELLKKNYPLRSSTIDTEILMYWLIAKTKSKDIPDIKGMYAFAFYDHKEEKLWLGRDPSGIKPLYYFENEDYLIVSSEIKGVLSSDLVRKELNEEQVGHYLQFKYAKSPYTFFKHIFEVNKTGVERYTLSDKKSLEKENIAVLSPSQNKKISLNNSTPEAIEDILKRVIQEQAQSQVPFGLMLSGGVDSTLLAAILQDLGFQNVPAYTVVNTSQERFSGTSDYLYAKKAAECYGLDQYELELGHDFLERNWLSYIEQLDQPVADEAGILVYYLSQVAQEKVKILLSGAGADEIFGGYHRHWAYYKYIKYHSFYPFYQPLLKIVVAAMGLGGNASWKSKVRRMHIFSSRISPYPEQTFLNFIQLFYDPPYGSSNQWPKKEAIKKALDHDRTHYLAQDILYLYDLMTMSNNIEMRVPYLAEDLIEGVRNLPSEYIFKQGPKWILKEILDRKGGKVFTSRRKEGFGMPFGEWIKSRTNFFEEQVLSFPDDHILYAYLAPAAIKKILKAHKEGFRDCSTQLWSLLLLSCWLKKHFT